jgi:hypothetical protein
VQKNNNHHNCDFCGKTKEEVEKIEWNGNYKDYDYNLFSLGKGHKEFIIINPAFENYKIKSIPYDANRCIVWKYKNQWVAKYFNVLWNIEKRYTEIEVENLSKNKY